MSEKANRILLIDDDRHVRRILSIGLQTEGYRVTEIESGPLGIEELNNGGFDFIVVDLNLPVIDGRAFIRAVRTKLNLRLPIVILASNDRAGTKEDLLKCGATAVLHKPAKVDEIVSKLQPEAT